MSCDGRTVNTEFEARTGRAASRSYVKSDSLRHRRHHHSARRRSSV